MKKVRTLVVMMCLLAVTTMMANPISENQAKNIASRFMASHAMSSTTLKMVQKGSKLSATPASADKATYYVFNNAQAHSGYVIVAGDDRAPAVLGYSDKGSFDPNNVPEALQDLLESYSAQIIALGKGGQTLNLNPSGEAILPMVTAAWTQNEPFNTLLPTLPNGQQAVAGCVATAMAQLLYYWKQPAQVTTTLPAYTSTSLGLYMPALEPVDFNWEAMQDVYLTNDTESESALAAAQLTLYCAQSVQMNFLYGTSGANTNHIPRILSTYFGFKGSAHCEYRENFTAQGWADFIYNEISEGRPVIYSGSKASSGHAFICDGYDGEGMFHINWGWGGMSNGYYLLNVLNPDAQGTGAANEAYGYIYGQYIIAGAEPGEDDSLFELTAGSVALNGAVTTRTSNNANFKATVTGRFFNYTNQTFAVSFGWGLYDGDELLSVLYQSGSSSLPSGYFFSTNAQDLNFGSNITSGTYRIVPIYSEFYANNWRPCKGGDINYIEVTIDGNNCTVIGCGTAGTRNYTVNDINHEGSMHNGRPIDITLNLTNDGYSQNDLLYMFVNNTFNSTAFVGLEHGETGDILFRFLPTTPGEYTCIFSFNQDGSDPLCFTTITVTEMPMIKLNVAYEVLNVSDATNYIVTDNKFRVKLTISYVNGREPYSDDITVKLYRNLDGTYGSNVQMMNQHAFLNPGETIEMQFDMDNVIDGWDYFGAIYYYSMGNQILSTTTPYYTISFPEEPVVPEVLLGDVNGDTVVSIADVTSLIDYLLGSNTGTFVPANADIDSSGSITIGDVTLLIDYLLNH